MALHILEVFTENGFILYKYFFNYEKVIKDNVIFYVTYKTPDVLDNLRCTWLNNMHMVQRYITALDYFR